MADPIDGLRGAAGTEDFVYFLDFVVFEFPVDAGLEGEFEVFLGADHAIDHDVGGHVPQVWVAAAHARDVEQGGVEEFVNHHGIELLGGERLDKVRVEVDFPAIGAGGGDAFIEPVAEEEGQCPEKRRLFPEPQDAEREIFLRGDHDASGVIRFLRKRLMRLSLASSDASRPRWFRFTA